MMAQFFLKESLEPGSVRPLGNRSQQGAPWGVYQCSGKERWCVITCRDDEDWSRLRKALGDPDWAADANYRRSKAAGRTTTTSTSGSTTWTASRPTAT